MIRSWALAIALAVATSAAQATDDFQDWWWNTALSGMGFNVGQQGGVVVIAWYLYNGDGGATFLLMSGELSNGAVSGSLFRSSGPLPANFDPKLVTSEPVGTATMSFQSSNSATFSYQYEGQSGSVALERYTYRRDSFSGEYRFAETGTVSGCTFPENNGAYDDTGTMSISENGSSITATNVYNDDTCSFSVVLSQTGTVYEGNGNFSCTSGLQGTLEIHDLRKTDDFLTLEASSQATTLETCHSESKFGAVK